MKFRCLVGVSFLHFYDYPEHYVVCSTDQEAVDIVCSQLRELGFYAGRDYLVDYVYRVCTLWSVSEQFVAQNGEGA